MASKPLTADQVKTKLRAQGITISQWAKDNDCPRYRVYRLLNGVDKGTFGHSHEIAVKLGMKPQPNDIASNVA